MNTDKAYAEKIASEYAPKEMRTVVALRKLDARAKLPATVFAYTFGTLMALNEMYRSIFSPAMTHFGVREAEKQYVFAFYMQGTVALIEKWLENDCRDDVDEIIRLIMKHTMADENRTTHENHIS